MTDSPDEPRMAPLSITIWALGIIFVWWAIVLGALGLIGGAVYWLIGALL